MALVPLKHQISGTNYLKKSFGGAVFSEPRSGKTLMVLNALKELDAYPALIICPNSVIASWYGALIEEGFPQDEILVYNLPNVSKTQIKSLNVIDKKITIINFEKVIDCDIVGFRSKVSKFFGLKDWKAIVFDESYKLASFESKISKHFYETVEFDESQVRICLTGTPICESVLDVVNQYIFLNGHFMGYKNPYEFRNAYFREFCYKWYPKNRIIVEKIKRFVKENSFQVTLESLGLGGKIFHGYELFEMTDLQKRLYRWVSLSSHYLKDGETMQFYPAIKAMFYQKISSGIHPITNEIIDTQKAVNLAKFAKETGESILVLSRFKTILKTIGSELDKQGVSNAIISGDTNLEDRDNIRKSFQCGKIKVVVAQVDAVARGLDFSRLNRIVYYTNTYSYEVREQSELRGQNVKRSTPYSVVDLCFKDSIDIKIRDILVNKKSNVSSFVPNISRELIELWSN
jgi:SNF2 family DNA or RNA helicase